MKFYVIFGVLISASLSWIKKVQSHIPPIHVDVHVCTSASVQGIGLHTPMKFYPLQVESFPSAEKGTDSRKMISIKVYLAPGQDHSTYSPFDCFDTWRTCIKLSVRTYVEDKQNS